MNEKLTYLCQALAKDKVELNLGDLRIIRLLIAAIEETKENFDPKSNDKDHKLWLLNAKYRFLIYFYPATYRSSLKTGWYHAKILIEHMHGNYHLPGEDGKDLTLDHLNIK